MTTQPMSALLSSCPFCGCPATEINVFENVSCSNPNWHKCNMSLWGMPIEQWQSRCAAEPVDAGEYMPLGSNADRWNLLLSEYPKEYCAVQIAEAIESAERNAVANSIDKMGWDEIKAFQSEMAKGQDIYEDAGGYFLRAIGALFGIKGKNELITYQSAMKAMIAKAHSASINT